jgi:head-tail adaptor
MPVGLRRRTPSGRRYHEVQPQNPVMQVSDGDGGYVQLWGDLEPAYAAIEPAGGRDLEVIAATVAGVATHVLTLPYQENVLPGATRVVFGTRVFSVLGMQDAEERHIELVLLCAEVLGGGADVVPTVIELLIADMGGEPYAFMAPAVADEYPAGATYDRLVPGSYPTPPLSSTRLPAGTYVLEATAKVAAAGARAKVALVALADPDVPVVEISFSTSEILGETERSAAFAVAVADTRYAVKLTTDDPAIGAAAWGCHILKV